jgi:hypothetical protein
MSNTQKQDKIKNSTDLLLKIENLNQVKGQSQSSLITLVIPPKYCI